LRLHQLRVEVADDFADFVIKFLLDVWDIAQRKALGMGG
jgi:hypothetical protein